MPANARSPLPPRRALLLPLLLATLVACEDGPTSPGIYTHEAEGSLWAAVVVPRSTPDLRTWLPYVRPRDADAEAKLQRVRELRAEVDALRRAGDIERAWEAEEEATMVAALAVTETVPASVLIASLGALDVWADRAAEAQLHEGLGDLQREVEQVRAHRRSAHTALQAGDTARAILEMAVAAARVRAQGPEVVAARALARAEERLALAPASDDDAARALRLLRHSREALAAGDAGRALRRALYALQLAEQSSSSQTVD